MSRTRLPDGRVICVAGEHEDSYDPDFCIYNDVIVVHPDGQIVIFGYPPEVFPPTDFHTATRDGDRIILIGSLGYPGKRQCGSTPVYSVDIQTFQIRPLQCEGDAPGWIYGHTARLDAGAGAVWVNGGAVIKRDGQAETSAPNQRIFRLDLRTGRWSVHDASAAIPPPLAFAWPAGWEPPELGEEARLLADAVARSVGPDHPLFARDYEALASSTWASLLRSLDDPDRFIVVEGPDWTGRVETPPRFETFRGIADWLRAAEAREGRWWSEEL